MIGVSDDGVRSGGWTGRAGEVEKISQAKRVVVADTESIRVNRIARIEGELFAGG